MANPVWVLSVDLQTKTATFQSGMADAAKSARGAFSDIKTGGGEMARDTSVNMMEARHGVMLLGEQFGIHLPRAVSTFVASIGPIGSAMQAAFPFLALITLAVLFVEHLKKVQEAGRQLNEDEVKFGVTLQNAFNTLNDKILQAEIRADELRKDHLGALQHQLELIDHQSMNELVHSFEEVAKAAAVVMKDLEGHWYTFGKGSEGAKDALNKFQADYNSLLAQGKSEEASGLLHGTTGQAEKVLGLLRQMESSGRQGGNPFAAFADPAKFHAAADELQRMSIAVNPEHLTKQIEAQENLVQALRAQVTMEEKIAELKKLQKSNATTEANQAVDKDADKLAKEQAAALQRGREEMARGIADQYKQEIADTQAGEREIIEATKQGSQERLTAIDAAIMEENALGLQETQFYRSLWQERIQLTRQMSEEEVRARQAASMEEAAHQEKMAQLELAAEKSAFQRMRETTRMSEEEILQNELAFANREFAIRTEEYKREIAALDKNGKDYELRLKQVQDRIAELTKEHENQVTNIEAQAEDDRKKRLKDGLDKERDEVSRGLTDVIMRHQTFAQMVTSLGDQVASSMMQNAIKDAMALDFTKEKDAAAAARKMFLAGTKFPFPVNIVMAPVLGAAAFAAVMAFEGGTDRVPGYQRGDSVPAMLTPGEGVVPGGVMDGLRNVARDGGFNRGPQIQVRAHFAPQIHAIDADGVDRMLDKHREKFQRHFENTVRNMNRG